MVQYFAGCMPFLLIFWRGLSGAVALITLTVASACYAADASELSVPVDVSRSVLDIGSQSFVVLPDVPASWTLAQVLALPRNSFTVFDPQKTYAASPGRVIWLALRIAAQGTQTPSETILEVPRPFIDDVQFHFQNQQGQWAVQVAGKLTPSIDWPLRGLYPRFQLPAPRASVQDVYVRLSPAVPIRADVRLETSNNSNFQLQNKLLVYGLLTGVIALMGVVSFVLAAFYRRPVYAWYGLYVAIECVAISNYLGLINYVGLLEPNRLTERSNLIGAVAVMAAKLQFCRAMFLSDFAARWLNKAALLSVATSTACIVGMLALPSAVVDMRFRLFFVAVTVSTMVLFVTLGWAVYLRNKVAWLWVLAFSPLFVLIILSVIDSMGLAGLPGLAYDVPVYAMTFEVMVLLFALQMHVKSGHAQQIREKTLSKLDPLTGFVAAPYYSDILALLWSQARNLRQDLAVAYVRAEVGGAAGSPGLQINNEDVVRRCVRILRMATRPQDTVACVDANLFAILMPGISPGAKLLGKLNRLRELGLMRDPDDLAGLQVRFQMAVTSFSSFTGTSGELDRALRQTLQAVSTTSERGIEFVKNR